MIRKDDSEAGNLEFLLVRKSIRCHADTKTRHAVEKYYAVVIAMKETTTMLA